MSADDVQLTADNVDFSQELGMEEEETSTDGALFDAVVTRPIGVPSSASLLSISMLHAFSLVQMVTTHHLLQLCSAHDWHWPTALGSAAARRKYERQGNHFYEGIPIELALAPIFCRPKYVASIK